MAFDAFMRTFGVAYFWLSVFPSFLLLDAVAMNSTATESNDESPKTAILRCGAREVDALSVCSTQSLSSERLANEERISASGRNGNSCFFDVQILFILSEC